MMNRRQKKAEIISKVFSLEKAIEFELGAEISEAFDCLRIRIEVLKNLKAKNKYFVRVLRSELFRIQPTSPQKKDGKPKHQPCDEYIWVEEYWLFPGKTHNSEVSAASATAALNQALKGIEKKLKTLLR